jgi:Tfp pilus assembly protein PilF
MKPRILVVALMAVLGPGCSTTTDKQRLSFRVEPLQTIHHGGPTAQSYYQLGRYYQGQDRLGQAEDAFLKAVAADDKYIDAFNALASLYARRGETERAVKMFEKLTAIAPEAAYLHNNLGFAYYLTGHQEEAYASVKKALTLDSTLERGWANLGLIAAKDGAPALVQAVRQHALDTLPLALGEPQDLVLPNAGKAGLAAATPVVPEAGFTVVTQPAPHSLVEEVRYADASNVVDTQQAPRQAGPDAASLNTPDGRSDKTSENEANSAARFVLVSTRSELMANGQPLEFPSAVDAQSMAPVATLAAIRLEVSNGNGISRFAGRFSSVLRSSQVPVAKITNYGSFSTPQTFIEYRAGYAAAAQALMQRINLDARLVPAAQSRLGVDVRIVLGHDALRFCPKACGGNLNPQMVAAAAVASGV